ncbi:MAG: hypothetical protein U1E56_01495 [Bauldia sp.]
MGQATIEINTRKGEGEEVAVTTNGKTQVFRSGQRIKIEQHANLGGLWFAAWLFTIGYLKLTFWDGVVGIILWPYYLGAHFAAGVVGG